MRLIVSILLLAVSKMAIAQIHVINADSLKLGETAGTNGIAFYGNPYFKNIGLGKLSDSILVRQADGKIKFMPRSLMFSGVGGGAVSSVFGRTGAVTAQSGDYSSFYYPLTGNPSGFLTSSYTPPSQVQNSLEPNSEVLAPSMKAVNDALAGKQDFLNYRNGVQRFGGNVKLGGSLEDHTSLSLAGNTLTFGGGGVMALAPSSLVLSVDGQYGISISNNLYEKMAVFDSRDITLRKGLEEMGDWSANKTDYSYVTKKMLNGLVKNSLTTPSTTLAPSVDAVNSGLALKQNLVSLTTTGTGAATFNQSSGALNVPTPNLSSYALDANVVHKTGNEQINGVKTFSSSAIFTASTTSGASINLPHGVAPTAPIDGDIWTTSSGLFARINGATRSYLPLSGGNLTGGLSGISARFTSYVGSGTGSTSHIDINSTDVRYYASNGTTFLSAYPLTLTANRTQRYQDDDGTIALIQNFESGKTIGANITGNAATASAVPWTGVTGKPTTVAGYGITDAYPLSGNPSGFLTSSYSPPSQVQNNLNASTSIAPSATAVNSGLALKSNLSGGNTFSGNQLFQNSSYSVFIHDTYGLSVTNAAANSFFTQMGGVGGKGYLSFYQPGTTINNYVRLVPNNSTPSSDITVQMPSQSGVLALDALKQNNVSLTTNGFGAATFNQSTGALNIPTPNLTSYALDADVVHKTGNETILDTKSFFNTIIGSVSTQPNGGLIARDGTGAQTEMRYNYFRFVAVGGLTTTLRSVTPTSTRTQTFQDDDGIVALTKNFATGATIGANTTGSAAKWENQGYINTDATAVDVMMVKSVADGGLWRPANQSIVRNFLALVQNNLTASTTVAPSATAVNTALALKSNAPTIRTITSNYTALITDETIATATPDLILTIPNPSSVPNKIYRIVDYSYTGCSLVTPGGAAVFVFNSQSWANPETSFSLTPYYTVQSDGSRWIVIGN